MQTKLIEVDSFLVGKYVIEIFYDLFGSIGVVNVVEDDVDGLGGDLFEIELRPDMCFKFS